MTGKMAAKDKIQIGDKKGRHRSVLPIAALGMLTLFQPWEHRSAARQWKPGEHRSAVGLVVCCWRNTPRGCNDGKRARYWRVALKGEHERMPPDVAKANGLLMG